MKLTPQGQTVLNHLRNEKYLTSWSAEGVYRIRRLASRIDELKAAGYGIEKSTAEDATGQRYTRYSLSNLQRGLSMPIHPPRRREPVFALGQVQDALETAGHCRCAVVKVLNILKEGA